MAEHIIRCECGKSYRSDVDKVNVFNDEGNANGTRIRSRVPCTSCGKRDGVQATSLPSALDNAQQLATDKLAKALTDAAVQAEIDKRVAAKMAKIAEGDGATDAAPE